MKAIFLFISLSLFKACPSNKMEQPIQPIVITTCDATTTLKRNTPFSIQLPISQGTGYDWAIVSQSNAATIEPFSSEGRIESLSNNDMVGTKANQIFDLNTTSTKGTNVIELHYRRSWEKNKSPEQVCKVTVVVK